MSSEMRKSQRVGARNPFLMPLEPLSHRRTHTCFPTNVQVWFQLLNKEYSQRSPKTTETQGILITAQLVHTEQGLWINS